MVITQQDIKNTVDSVKYNISGVETILDQKEAIKNAIADYTKELTDIESRIEFLADTKQFYIKAVDLMYEESIGALKDTLNTALQYIMFDKNYTCNLTLEDKRGTKNLYISLNDLDDDVEVDMKHGVGQGLRSVVSAVLKTFYLLNQNSTLLFIDEKYSFLSDQYIPRFFDFLKQLCEDKGLILVAITHDERFFDYADRCYVINDGNIRLVQKDENIVLEKEEGREE